MQSLDRHLGPSSPLRILLVAHTHWDREWYHPAARFRQRLVPLVDALLDAAEHAGAPFLLDGQAIVLDDYAAVRPERFGALSRALSDGTLEAGPWYVLADNLIPSGEALLRNLEAGRRVLERYSATAPAVAYCPDSFGHPAALPMIAAGYGFPLAIVWRGLASGTDRGDAVWWNAADGSRVLVHHLPPDGYETGSSLPDDASRARPYWARTASLLQHRNRTGVTLLPSGADHHAAQTGLPKAVALGVEMLRERDVVLQRVTLSQAAVALSKGARAAEANGIVLPHSSGELRDSYGYTWTLQGTFATRAHQKRTNARLERALLSDVEPWLVLAALHGQTQLSGDGRVGAAQTPALLAHAWETLLSTHPHDTLCGCSIDDVARAMEASQASVMSQAIGLRAAALEAALQHDTVAARARRPDDRLVVVRNRVPYARGGVAELRLADTIGDVPVGPGSAGAPVARAAADVRLPTIGSHPVQGGSTRIRHARRESPQHYPDNDAVLEHRVLAWVPPVPAYGLSVLDRGDARSGNGTSAPLDVGDVGHASPTDAFERVTVHEHDDGVTISNGILELTASAAGVRVRLGNRTLPSALSIETARDHGDSYTPSLRGPAERLSLESVRVLARGPLRASVALEWARVEPCREDAPADLDRHEAPASRSKPNRTRRARVHVRTMLVIDAASDVIRCDVVTRNRMRDHRLQLVWHTDIAHDATVHADVAFGHIDRSAELAAHGRAASRVPDTPGAIVESRPGTMPMHRWLCTSDARSGVTMFSDGLAEGAVQAGRLAVTLVRAIGELSRGDVPERPGHAGWPAAVPAAQCQGEYRARLGLLLHGTWGDDTLQQIERAADSLLLPLVGETWRDLDIRIRELSGPTLVGAGLRVSAVTLSRDAHALILRARNTSGESRDGAWIMPPTGAWRVTECRLDETPTGPPRECRDRVGFTVGPRALLTLRVERVAG
ncbi:MAG TPA: hypothetical protein VE869_09460 [Gemmatimonas sp.]|nr:hypothetical protein [Gemmatimonas sp.]